MLFLCIFLSVVVVTQSYGLYKVIMRGISLKEHIEEIYEQIESSLDIIDQSHRNIAKRLTYNVLTDDPVVRGAVEDMKSAKNVLLLIANKITEPLKKDEGI